MNKMIKRLKKLAMRKRLVARYAAMTDNEVAQHIKKKETYTQELTPSQREHLKGIISE